MLAASHDIDYFIERQRSKLNKQPNRLQLNRSRPIPPIPPPPVPSYIPPTNPEERLDFKVARILDEPPPRIQSQQPYYPPSPTPFPTSSYSSPLPPIEPQMVSYSDQPQRRRYPGNNINDNQPTFFDRFGEHEGKRAQLKNDLKREYNEFLRSQRVPKSKSTSQLASPSPRGNTTRRVQFQQDGMVVAPWEKNSGRTMRNVQSMDDIFSSSSTTNREYLTTNRSQSRVASTDEQYIRDREEYILELYDQIRELETRKRQLELESSRFSGSGTSNTTRAHYTEDLNALNTLLAQRIDQRNNVDLELARILNRPPVSGSPTLVNSGRLSAFNMPFDQPYEPPSQQSLTDRRGPPNRNRSRPNNDGGFQIGQDVDKDADQAAKKRYQQELQAQMREAQMRKLQAKQEKDEYEKKLESDINRYNYFGRSGGGAPMRDKEGNVIANLADLRNPQQQTARDQIPGHVGFDDKVYTLGAGTSSIANAPFYNGDQQSQYPSQTARPESPNHTRGAVSNGIFGTAKTEEQVMREERYKQDLKRQIDEKRQRNAEELSRRRAEEERELAKHFEWQQQMEKQMADEAARKQDKEAQDRLHQQQMQDELERQRRQEELAMKRKPKRQEKTMSPRDDDDDNGPDRQNTYDDGREQPYRSVSPPVPTLKNKGKKQKSNVRRSPDDDPNQQQSLPALFDNNDESLLPPIDDNEDQDRSSYRKPPTPKQPDVPVARKKAPPSRSRPVGTMNPGYPIRTNSMVSLRSDGSDSEVLNRLEHLKRQLKDKEARLHQHAKAEAALLSDIEEQSAVLYRPPSETLITRRQSPGYLLNTARVHHRDFPTTSNDKLLRVLQADDDDEFKPSYFRDDSILMRGGGGMSNGEYISPSKRVDLSDGIFVTNIEDAARRRKFRPDPPGYYDRGDPTSMANLELSRIVEQNEHRLKKLRDLEKDDTSLLDSNEVLERFQQKQRLQRRGSHTTLQDDAWLK